MALADQLVVPLAVPLPPRLLVHVTRETPTSSVAVPVIVTVLPGDVYGAPLVGAVMETVGRPMVPVPLPDPEVSDDPCELVGEDPDGPFTPGVPHPNTNPATATTTPMRKPERHKPARACGPEY